MASRVPGGMTSVAERDPAQTVGHVVVRASGLHKSYDGEVAVLNGIDLTVDDGEFVALLGRSGGGKTTMLRILEGLDEDYDGSVEVTTKRSVVFQDPRLLPWRRVWENVVLGIHARSRELRAIADVALDEVGLSQKADVWPGTLSGGEAQRVGLARALVREPSLLLLDEPFGALDALTRIRMHELLRSLIARHAPGVVLVTHDVQEAIDLADRIVVLDSGRIAHSLDVHRVKTGPDPDARLASLKRNVLAALGVDV